MPYNDLHESDRLLIGKCLRAAADGPFFPDWEFQTLFGLDRGEVRNVADMWPELDPTNNDVILAINNALNMLQMYPIKTTPQEWDQWIGEPKAQLWSTLSRWRGEVPDSNFDAMM